MLRLFWVKRKPETKGEKMERVPTKPLSRKKLRQLAPRFQGTTGGIGRTFFGSTSSYNLQQVGHKIGGNPHRRTASRRPRWSALDGFYVVKPQKVVG